MKCQLAVKCPTCRKVGQWFLAAYGPFCSERCRLVDLGNWFNEVQRISEPLHSGHFIDHEPAPEDASGNFGGR